VPQLDLAEKRELSLLGFGLLYVALAIEVACDIDAGTPMASARKSVAMPAVTPRGSNKRDLAIVISAVGRSKNSPNL